MTHEEYVKAAEYWKNKAQAEYKKIPISALEKLESPMNLICVTPETIEVLCSDFKKDGYSSRQTLKM